MRLFTRCGVWAIGVAAVVAVCSVALPATATTFQLPFSEDFESYPLGPDSDWICTPAAACVFLSSNNGSANETNVVSDAFLGQRAYEFVIDSLADPNAFRAEGQSHPASDDFFKGDTLWVGYAYKVPADFPNDPHFTRAHQLKLLDPQCQVSLGHQDDEWRYQDDFGTCGGSNKSWTPGIPLGKGAWHTIVVKHVLTDNGGHSVWIDNAEESNPDLLVENRQVFPAASQGSPCYLKIGMYKGWWRVYPEDIIPARWSALYDSVKLCVGGTPGCGFSFVLPRGNTSPPDAGVDSGASGGSGSGGDSGSGGGSGSGGNSGAAGSLVDGGTGGAGARQDGAVPTNPDSGVGEEEGCACSVPEATGPSWHQHLALGMWVARKVR